MSDRPKKAPEPDCELVQPERRRKGKRRGKPRPRKAIRTKVVEGARRGIARMPDHIEPEAAEDRGSILEWLEAQKELDLPDAEHLYTFESDLPELEEHPISGFGFDRLISKRLKWAEETLRVRDGGLDAVLSDRWYAREIVRRVRRAKDLSKELEGDELAEICVMIGILIAESRANDHPRLSGSSRGGKNKADPHCKREGCEGYKLSECGHKPWQEDVVALFTEVKELHPSLTQREFAKTARKRLKLDVSEGRIRNVLSKRNKNA